MTNTLDFVINRTNNQLIQPTVQYDQLQYAEN